jgi:hypothetical protein
MRRRQNRIPERHDRPAFLAIATRLIRPGERRPARVTPAGIRRNLRKI